MTGVQTCAPDRKSTRLNSSHTIISYAVFCLNKENRSQQGRRRGIPVRAPREAGPGRQLGHDWRGRRRGGEGHRYSFIEFPYFFFNDTATTEIYTLSLHDALPI